jgi:hypothetical protein
MARSRSAGAMTKAGRWRFCITKKGLEAVNVEDETTAASKEPSVRHSPNPEVKNPAPDAIASRKQISVATQKSTRKKHHPGKAKTKAVDSRPSSKEARVLAMLGRPEGVMPERDRDQSIRPLPPFRQLQPPPDGAAESPLARRRSSGRQLRGTPPERALARSCFRSHRGSTGRRSAR